MRFDIWTKSLSGLAADCIAVGVHDDGTLSAAAAELDRSARGRLAQLVKRGDLSGRAAESLLVLDMPGIKATRVLLVGLGSKSAFTRKAWRRAFQSVITAVSRTKMTRVAVALPQPKDDTFDAYRMGRAAAEITAAALYRVNDLKSGRKPKLAALAQVVLAGIGADGASAAKRGLAQGEAVAIGARAMRDLANLPGNVCTPTFLGNEAKRIAAEYRSVSVRVLDEAAIRREKMGCFLAVTQGSEQAPRFIVLSYRGGRRDAAPIVLVGKGVTFDTGGISLKDPPAMDEMKFDMSGAAAVLSVMRTIAELALPINVHVLVPACENMPSGRAIKPGDIVTSASGQTVEILNTDAEGRLILCDALHYARRFKPAAVVDVATLTGACVIALGQHHTGIMANDDSLARELVDAGVRADDRAWQLPLTEEYGEQLKSNFADMANVAGRDGGAITAAAFLGKFTQGMRWAHLDIAGSAYVSGAQKGSTGRPMALLAEFLLQRAGRI